MLTHKSAKKKNKSIIITKPRVTLMLASNTANVSNEINMHTGEAKEG